MKNVAYILVEVFQFLNKRRYAVLRNYYSLPHASGRDIDIIIERRDFFIIRKSLAGLFFHNGFYLIQYYEGSEMHSMVFASSQLGKTDIISFDFLFSIYVRNLVLFEAKDLLETRIFNGEIFHVRKDWEFLAKYTYNTILKEDYPLKYEAVKAEALNLYPLEIGKALKSIGINDCTSGVRAASVSQKLWVLHFVRTSYSTLRYCVATISNLFYPKGISVGFTGPDGSGKTTVIDQIRKRLQAVYPSILLLHHRPALMGNLGEVAHFAGIKKGVDRQFDKPHRGKKRGKLSSILRLAYYSTDYVGGYFIKVHPFLFKRSIIIFDRYYTDIICDSRRSSIYLSHKFLYWFGRLSIPSLRYNILLTADSQTILERKQELDKESIDVINHKIDYLATKKGYYKVMNEGTPQEAVEKILQIIFEEQHKMNIKRL